MVIKSNKQFLAKTLVIIGFWAILAILSSLAVFLDSRLLGKQTWLQFLLHSGIHWFIWIVLTPFVLWLSDTFSFERKKWKRSVLLHLFSSLFFSILYSIIRTLFIHWGEPFPEIFMYFRNSFIRQAPAQLFFYWGLLGISHAIKYYRIARDREIKAIQLEKELSDARLQFLKNQLHPHFLFNTMHTIANLIREKSYNTSIEMISGFSELLRISIANLNTQFVSLKEEVDYINLYLNIEKIRFKDRLSTKVGISPEVISCQVPFLLLQPFLENSIKHGLTKHEDSQFIHISAAKENQNLIIKIEDNGPGIPDNWSLEKNSGIGLGNTFGRLTTIYGSSFTMELKNRDNSGVTVTIILPFSKTVK